MRTFLNSLLFLVVLDKCITFPHVRRPLIIEGFDCMPEYYPFLITIRKAGNQNVCGGSLIKDNWVLTAGHCCHERKAEELFVCAGLHLKYMYVSTNQTARIKQMFVHPKFTRNTLENDICLIMLETSVQSSRRVSYMNLFYDKPNVEMSKSCLILGFGRQSRLSEFGINLEPNKSFDPRLKCAHLSVIEHSICKIVVPVAATHFCAVDFSEKQQDACIGDSGGPLICNGSQIGIISGGYGCGLPHIPSLFTRLDIYKDFITDTINNNKNSELIFKMSSSNVASCKFKVSPNVVLLIFLIFIKVLNFSFDEFCYSWLTE